MNMPAIFAFNAAAVRVFNINDVPWFMAGDVAGILGYRDALNMVRMLDDDEKGTHIVSTLGGDQEVSTINESGLYACVLKSRRPEAKTFRKWVTSEVLPSIRQHGRYGVPSTEGLSRDEPLSLSHRADIAVAADRTFRAMMRSGRTVGLTLPQALRRANEITLHKTGVDMLRELGAEDALTPSEAGSHDHYGVTRFFTDWIGGALPVPFVTCRSSQFYRAYALWAGKNGVACCPISLFYTKAHAFRDRVKKGMVHTHDKTFRAVIPVGAKVGVSAGEWQRHTAEEMSLFDDALEAWEATAIN